MPAPHTSLSTASGPAPYAEPPLYISPILEQMDEPLRPSPSPACETCPASLWFRNKDQLRCFCTRMHLIVWDDAVQPILKCDGRELALIALQASLAE